MTYGNIRLPKE